MVYEGSHHGVMPLRHGPHEGRLSSGVLRRVDVRASREQRPHRIDTAGPRGGHDRRLALWQRDIRTSPRRQETFHHQGATVVSRQPERSGAQFVGGTDIGAGINQKVGDRQVVTERRPVQRRNAVPVCDRVDR